MGHLDQKVTMLNLSHPDLPFKSPPRQRLTGYFSSTDSGFLLLTNKNKCVTCSVFN